MCVSVLCGCGALTRYAIFMPRHKRGPAWKGKYWNGWMFFLKSSTSHLCARTQLNYTNIKVNINL